MGKRPASPSIPTDEDSCKFWKPGDVGNAFEIVIEAVGDHEEETNLATFPFHPRPEARHNSKKRQHSTQNTHSPPNISFLKNSPPSLSSSAPCKKSAKMETRPRSLSAHGPHPKKHDPILSKIISGTLHQKYTEKKSPSSPQLPPFSPSSSPNSTSTSTSSSTSSTPTPTPIQRRGSFRRCTVLIPNSNNTHDVSNTSPLMGRQKTPLHATTPKHSLFSHSPLSPLSSPMASPATSPPTSPPMSPSSSPPRSVKESPKTMLDSVKGTASSIKRAISCPVINSCVLLDSLLHSQSKSPLLAPPFHTSPPLSPHNHSPSPRFASANGMRTTPRATDANHKVTWWGATNIGSRQENQDCYMLPADECSKEFLFFGVFDGHGPEGKHAANCAKNSIQTFYEENIGADDTRINPNLMRGSFLTAHNAILEKAQNDFGTTAVVAGLHMPSSQLFFGWVGDSKAIVCRKQKPNPGVTTTTSTSTSTSTIKDGATTTFSLERDVYTSIELTRDHVLSLPEEMDRVYASGGIIRAPGGMSRVFLPELYSSFYGVKVGGLNMSRALGHMYLSRFGVVPDPDFGEEGLQPEDFVILATDGLWGRMTPSEVATFITDKQMHSPKEISVALIEEVKVRWGAYADNITIVVLKTSYNT